MTSDSSASPRLILIGGPPAVGKSTVAPLLMDRLGRSAWLDGDDVWRVRPVEVTPATRALVESNIGAVLDGFIRADYPEVLLTWVLHRTDLIDRLVAPFRSRATIRVVHLTAGPDAIRDRCARDAARGRTVDQALERLEQILALDTEQLDTSALTPAQVADALADRVLTGGP